jgi:hypothetical protein
VKTGFFALMLWLAPTMGLAVDGPVERPGETAAERVLSLTRVATSFNCRDVSCKYLSSCAEACYKLIQCGQSIRDRDKDGIPCENLCSRPCPR